MHKMLKKLIEKRFYETKEEAQNKLDVFYACNRLSDDEYSELSILVETVYEE